MSFSIPLFVFLLTAVVYLELWKRYSANLIYRWGLVQFCPQAEHARPEYLAKLRTAKKQVFNFDTKVSEPRVPFWKKKFPMYLFSFSVVILFVSATANKITNICSPPSHTIRIIRIKLFLSDSLGRCRRIRSNHLSDVNDHLP